MRLNSQSLVEQVAFLESLVKKIKETKDIQGKLQVLDALHHVQEMSTQFEWVPSLLQDLDLQDEVIIKSIFAIGQGEIIFQRMPKGEGCQRLLEKLRPVERFYDTIGGLAGYHLMILELLQQQASVAEKRVDYIKPPGTDLTQDTLETRQAVLAGLKGMKETAEIYPLGGAGDRLRLVDEESGEPMPTAQLIFCGHTLLENLVRDLQGREYLYFKLFGEQVTVPIAMMTSQEKNNDRHILEMCESKQWFGRPEETFFIFTQPLVPVITEEGNWAVRAPGELFMKPGGHGVIWKLASDEGVFEHLLELGCRKALVRQINNPIAGTDHGLLAFTGVGMQTDKIFGFASCHRLLNTAEGVNVLIEEEETDGYAYCLTNIEYTDFKKRGIQDIPESAGSPYSAFPTNTNILFVDLAAIKEYTVKNPIPGMLINMKNRVTACDADGSKKVVRAGRLESTMQNLADSIVDRFPEKLHKGEFHKLHTFLTYNNRRKTISVTKNLYTSEKTLLETPEGAFYEKLENYYDLLSNFCGMRLPPMVDEKEYLEKGPSFLIHLHPALGPLYSIVAQKVRGGRLFPGAELFLEVAEAEIVDLHLEGSFIVRAHAVTGKQDARGVVHYGSENGKCVLKGVSVHNKGVDKEAHNIFWKHQVVRSEALQIILHGNAEFHAEDVAFEGPYRIEVPAGHRTVAKHENGALQFFTEEISEPTWSWSYTIDEESRISLKSK